jgi:5-enolpyruvylshikimate-3-phosphate synthase
MSKANFASKTTGFPALPPMTTDAVYDRSRNSQPGQDVRNGIWFRTFESPSMQKQKLNVAAWHDRSDTDRPGFGHNEHLLLSVVAVLLAGVSNGRSQLRNLLDGPDVGAACRALAAMGGIVMGGHDGLAVSGTGNGALLQPHLPLDFIGAPLAHALTVSLVAPYDMPVSIRPAMLPEGLVKPMRQMGVQIEVRREGGLHLYGLPATSPLLLHLAPPGSAVLKAGLMLAGLNTPGITTLVEPMGATGVQLGRLEALFAAFGADISVRQAADGVREIRLFGRSRLSAAVIDLLAGR